MRAVISLSQDRPHKYTFPSQSRNKTESAGPCGPRTRTKTVGEGCLEHIDKKARLKVEGRNCLIICERGESKDSLSKNSTHTRAHTHIHRQGYPRWPAGYSRPLGELKATEDKQEGGKEGQTDERKRDTVAFTGEEKVKYTIYRSSGHILLKEIEPKGILQGLNLTLRCASCHRLDSSRSQGLFSPHHANSQLQ